MLFIIIEVAQILTLITSFLNIELDAVWSFFESLHEVLTQDVEIEASSGK